MPVRADVKQRQKTLGDHPGVLVHQQDRADADQQNKDAFGKFYGSHQPQEASLRGTEDGFRYRRRHAAALATLRISRSPQRGCS